VKLFQHPARLGFLVQGQRTTTERAKEKKMSRFRLPSTPGSRSTSARLSTDQAGLSGHYPWDYPWD
jgi:hypothetical protein